MVDVFSGVFSPSQELTNPFPLSVHATLEPPRISFLRRSAEQRSTHRAEWPGASPLGLRSGDPSSPNNLKLTTRAQLLPIPRRSLCPRQPRDTAREFPEGPPLPEKQSHSLEPLIPLYVHSKLSPFSETCPPPPPRPYLVGFVRGFTNADELLGGAAVAHKVRRVTSSTDAIKGGEKGGVRLRMKAGDHWRNEKRSKAALVKHRRYYRRHERRGQHGNVFAQRENIAFVSQLLQPENKPAKPSAPVVCFVCLVFRPHNLVRNASPPILLPHIVCASVARPGKETQQKGLRRKHFSKSLLMVLKRFTPRRLSVAMPTQFFPAMATTALPLYSS